MSDRSILRRGPDEVLPASDPVDAADREVDDIVMLISAALAMVFAVGLLALGA